MKEVQPQEAFQKKYPEQVVLVVTWDEKNNRPNIITLGWSMQTSFNPPMIAISVGKTRHSHGLISKTKEFVLCFPTEKMEKEVLFCGSTSGSQTDKFKEIGLTPIPSKKVKPPLIKECLACFECKVAGILDTGDHTIFAGEVLKAYISETPSKRIYNFGGANLKGL